MNTEDALDFLRAHQPMPADSELSSALMKQYDEARKHFIANPDSRCIPLFINSFGDGDGLGVYQLVEDAFSRIDPQIVTQELKAGLESQHRPTRYWSAQIAATFPAVELCVPLCDMLRSSCEDERASAVIALGQIGSPEARVALEGALRSEASEQVVELIKTYTNNWAN